jgi:hypothetical protein
MNSDLKPDPYTKRLLELRDECVKEGQRRHAERWRLKGENKALELLNEWKNAVDMARRHEDFEALLASPL